MRIGSVTPVVSPSLARRLEHDEQVAGVDAVADPEAHLGHHGVGARR